MQSLTQLFKRKINSHKKDFGHVFILAGSRGFTGAGILTASACLRSGAGLVTLGVPKSLISVFEKRVVEVMTKPLANTKNGSLSLKAYPGIIKFIQKADVLVIGPGLSQNSSTQKLIRKLIYSKINIPLVIDADGINALVNHLDILSKTREQRPTTILTPHPGEFARLLNKPTSYIQKNRLELAKKFAKDYGVILVLKGHNTIVCDNSRHYINKTGNPGMATAGSGDVLTGIITALLAQKIDAFSASKTAAYVHGASGDIAKKELGEISLIATDIIKFLPKAFKKLYNIHSN